MSSEESALARKVAELEARLEDLTAAFHQFRVTVRQSQPTSGYSVISSSPPSEAAASGTSSCYNVLATEIPAVPDFAVRSCSLLSGGSLSHREHASRAWESGWWARFCLEGKVAKPRPSKPIDLQNQVYIVLKADGYDCPLLFTKASDYRAVVKDFQGATISHGFPSQAEAKIYCLGAGVDFPSQVSTWTPSR